MAYREPADHSVAQYKLIDDAAAGVASSRACARPTARAKPSYAAYRLPIWVVRDGRAVDASTGRSAPRPTARRRSTSSTRPRAGSWFQTVQTVTVSSLKGQFTVPVANQGGLWRLRWNGVTSREAEVAPR